MRTASYSDDKQRRLPYFLQGMLAVVIVFLLVLLVYLFLAAASWVYRHPVQRVTVNGALLNVDQGRLSLIVQKNLQGQSWLSIPISSLRTSLQELPWVENTDITKTWPWGLNVTIYEQHAIAKWGAKELLTSSGAVIVPTEWQSWPDLVQLSGPDVAEAKVFSQYQALLPTLQAAGIKITAVALSDSGQWLLRTASGLQLRLGRNDLQQRLQRVIIALPELEAIYGPRMQYIDARYPNGVAVK